MICNCDKFDYFGEHYQNLPMQYTEIFKVVKNEKFQYEIFAIFLIFVQNIDCGIPLHTPVLLYKSGV